MLMTGLESSDKNLHRGEVQRHEKTQNPVSWCLADTHLSHIFKVVVSFLQGPSSVKGFPHAGVFAEERFTVVLDPVYHLDEAKRSGH